MGAVFPLTGFTEMPKAGSVPQQPVQQPGLQTLQQQVQQLAQPQLSMPQVQMMKAMQARLGTTGRNVGSPFTGNVSEFPGSTPQPGTTNTAQYHQQVPPGINLEAMQAFIQRKQDS